MTVREFIALGTSSQVPTRARAHHAAALRWDDELVILDPGEGAQRQMTLAGLAAGDITRICLTHLHGDHCLGLPGVLARINLDGPKRPVDLYYPASGRPHIDALLNSSAIHSTLEVRHHPVADDGPVDRWGDLALSAYALDHRVETYGWRIAEADTVRMLPDRLAAHGVVGPDVGRVRRDGVVTVDGALVRLADVSVPRPGQVFAFVMDTRTCDGAALVADRADLLVCESTYRVGEERLAHEHAHLTSRQAGELARSSGVRRLVLTHFSQRHPDHEPFAVEARELHPDVTAVRDLDRVPVPSRHRPDPAR